MAQAPALHARDGNRVSRGSRGARGLAHLADVVLSQGNSARAPAPAAPGPRPALGFLIFRRPAGFTLNAA